VNAFPGARKLLARRRERSEGVRQNGATVVPSASPAQKHPLRRDNLTFRAKRAV
jgi:hypothetical protein